jgi:hypothetical protein
MHDEAPAAGSGDATLSRRPAPGTPTGHQGGLGPFVTYIEYRRPDGLVAQWESRRHRKHAEGDGSSRTWWAPQTRGWWIGILFATGSALFAIGAVPGYATEVGARTDSITFFIGSLFFTSAGFLQYRESVDAGRDGPDGRRRRVFVYRPQQIHWWASGTQLIGTLCFNVSTGNAIRVDLTTQAAHQHVWRPDAFGSVCFLVASGLAWSPRRLSWWITLLNLVGSIAFGVSAIAGYIAPSTGQIKNAEVSNLGTFIGALCFLAGAVLLLPERTESPASP